MVVILSVKKIALGTRFTPVFRNCRDQFKPQRFHRENSTHYILLKPKGKWFFARVLFSMRVINDKFYGNDTSVQVILLLKESYFLLND